MKKRFFAVLAALGVAMSVAACAGQKASIHKKVVLITIDQMDAHWVRLREGAEAKVAEYNEAGNEIEFIWMAPETKNVSEQIQKIESAAASGADYLIIACADATACNRSLEEAIGQGVKIIYVDSPATVEGLATYATDNFQGGVDAGNYLLNALSEAGITKGMIGIVDAQPGADATQKRYDGFASVFVDTEFELGERQYSDGDNSRAQEIANTLISNGVVALYATNEGSTSGTAAAVADAMNNGEKVYCVGWDKSDANINYVKNGTLLAFMAQNPVVMGEGAIDAVVAIEKGEKLSAKIVDTGVSVIDAENVADVK